MSKLSLIDRMLIYYGVIMPNHPRKWWVHERLRKLFNTATDGEFEVERAGLRWRLNPADFEHESLFWLGGMDKWDIYHLKTLLTPGCVFFDVGANFGYYSLTVAQSLKGNCRVQAFEPNPRTRDRLLWNVAANAMSKVVTVQPVALSDCAGTATLIVRGDNSGAARLGTDSPGVSVNVTSLDLFCLEQSIDRIDVIKIDVEGYEVKVLRGALEILERVKPALIVEFWPPGLSRAAATVDDISKLLLENGYKLYLPIKESLVPVVDVPRGEVPVNLFAFHEQRPMISYRQS
jgi:FkbM family methyltransferase